MPAHFTFNKTLLTLLTVFSQLLLQSSDPFVTSIVLILLLLLQSDFGNLERKLLQSSLLIPLPASFLKVSQSSYVWFCLALNSKLCLCYGINHRFFLSLYLGDEIP